MLARLILALLLAAFAVPVAAPAACHDAPVAASHAMPMEHVPEKATPPHGCIGCVPPSTWIAAPMASASAREPVMLTARVAVLDIGTGSPPALPPPRGA